MFANKLFKEVKMQSSIFRKKLGNAPAEQFTNPLIDIPQRRLSKLNRSLSWEVKFDNSPIKDFIRKVKTKCFAGINGISKKHNKRCHKVLALIWKN